MFAVTERLEKEYIRKMNKAREEGRKEAIKETEKIIKNMLKVEIPIDLISKYTGISKEEINRIRM